MNLGLNVQLEPADVDTFRAWVDAVGRKSAREQLLPIMKAHLEPLVKSEKSFLADHNESGALSGSLSARAGTGDRPGSMSSFVAPTATTKQLQSTWGKGRSQQRKWAAKIAGKKGRTRVFYGPIVHQGHRIVKRNAAGQLYDTGKRTKPVPFAKQAVESIGAQQSEALAAAIMDHILEG